jgi:hypothetical protein
MRKKPTIPFPAATGESYLMGIADKLSDDPMLLQLLGPHFKVIVEYDPFVRRVTYSFRLPEDNEPDDAHAKAV